MSKENKHYCNLLSEGDVLSITEVKRGNKMFWLFKDSETKAGYWIWFCPWCGKKLNQSPTVILCSNIRCKNKISDRDGIGCNGFIFCSVSCCDKHRKEIGRFTG